MVCVRNPTLLSGFNLWLFSTSHEKGHSNALSIKWATVLQLCRREVRAQGHAMLVYLVCAHFSRWLRTKNGECQAGSGPSQITQKCAFLSPWVSPVVFPLRQTDTNSLNKETREWRHWVNEGVWCSKRSIVTRPNKLNLNPDWNYRLRGIFQSCEVMDMYELPKQ